MPTQRAEHRPHAFLNLVVTPESIPKFIIPRLGSSTRSQGPHCPPAQCAGALCAEDQEPGTRLAMSLPHLRRVTTPYGFLALGESPCVYRKESLFFGGSDDSWGAVRFGLSNVRTGGQPGPRGLTPPRPVHLVRGRSCTSLPSPQPSPPSCPGKTSRSFSWDLSVPSRHLRLGVPDGKTRLQRLIRKHLSRAQKKRRARGCSSSGGVEEESGSSGE